MKFKKFPALGTDVEVYLQISDKREGAIMAVEREIRAFEDKFSRFLPGSELTRLNRASGKTISASPMMLEILRQALWFYRETGGIFDPTVFISLNALGYDQSFDRLNNDEADRTEDANLEIIKRNFKKRPRFDELTTDNGRVKVPDGMKIDLGGIGKGFIIDYLGQGLLKNYRDYWISAGGDLTVKGSSGDESGWIIAVQDPKNPERDIFNLTSRGKNIGVATSGVIKRRGRRGGYEWHHLIDPRTGLPADNDILSATVIAPSATAADIYAKTVLILGTEAGIEFIDQRADCAAIIFTKSQGALLTSCAREYMETQGGGHTQG